MKGPTLAGLVLLAPCLFTACGESADQAIPQAEQTAAAPIRTWGYLDLSSGERLRYTAFLPPDYVEGKRYPVLVEYDGYNAGDGLLVSEKEWATQEGYALVGLSVPGSGCSTGDYVVFAPHWGAAGAEAVDQLAALPWADGRLGMIGVSYSGYMQLWVAAFRPKSLLAISPAMNVTDPYRDVAYPGGIRNKTFPPVWAAGVAVNAVQAAQRAYEIDGDSDCLAVGPANGARMMSDPDRNVLTLLLQHPYQDDWYLDRSALRLAHRIAVPTLGIQAWQDDATGPRGGYFDDVLVPGRTWMISSNGPHRSPLSTPYVYEARKRFFAHFVKGERNGFDREPHLRVLHELHEADAGKLEPNWIDAVDHLPATVTPMRLYLRAGGVLSTAAPEVGEGGATYAYPVEGPSVNFFSELGPTANGERIVSPWTVAGATTWPEARSVPGSAAVFTTPPLPQDLHFLGEGSADLWLSATAADTDLQVTLSEVRPDGQEAYVQRGWLRASHRALDETRSTALRPWHLHTQEAQAELTPLAPALARVEINKFAHVFRKGSSIRLIVDTPSPTGYWGFDYLATPSQNTIWHDATQPSSLVLGYRPAMTPPEFPECSTVLFQPCRTNQTPVPSGIGPSPPR